MCTFYHYDESWAEFRIVVKIPWAHFQNVVNGGDLLDILTYEPYLEIREIVGQEHYWDKYEFRHPLFFDATIRKWEEKR